ncbi:hypothetical protein HRbin40_02682 [bacterium HR40]|nr:hypothetical protein HRbin40_02682 [bacterium HR40]
METDRTLQGIAPQLLFLEPGEDVPNHPLLPVLLYGRVLPSRAASAADVWFVQRLAANGWGGIWRGGIFSFPHFHTTAHEALAVARGRARLRLGGRRGAVLEVGAGDLLVLPAGTGHERLAASRDLLVVGAYPSGQSWDLGRLGEDLPSARRRIAGVPLPATDPLFGVDGPLVHIWRQAVGCSGRGSDGVVQEWSRADRRGTSTQ